jgi:hypothetical protein
MTLKDFIQEPPLAKVGSVMRRCLGEDTSRAINQHTYDKFGWDFTGWVNREMPDIKKVSTIQRYKQMYPECLTFVETGTYFGATSESVAGIFEKVYTIEIDPWLHHHASERLWNRYYNVICINGDSGKILPRLLCHIHTPVLYWLDAHYSGGITARGNTETPIEWELTTILKHSHANKSVILIDDARCFGAGDYPTLDRVRELTERFFAMSVVDDIIRLVPNKVRHD